MAKFFLKNPTTKLFRELKNGIFIITNILMPDKVFYNTVGVHYVLISLSTLKNDL